MSDKEIMEGEDLLLEEKIEESLAEERDEELERLLYRDEHQIEESPIKKKLRREAERECLSRLESIAKTEDDFREIVRQYDRMEENQNRRFRYHETIRGDVPLEYGMDENPAVFPAYLNNIYWKSMHSGNFLEVIFDCPHEIDEMTSHRFISGFLRGMKDEYKELLYWLAIRGYGAAELGHMLGQSDRNVRKKYSRLLARIREKLYKYLLKRDKKGLRLTEREINFLAEYEKRVLDKQKGE